MGYWNTRGLRGSAFEDMINRTNEAYMQKGLAVIQKVHTPITPVEIDNKTGLITKAYFEKKSTVDYIGTVQGIPVCFDAKETGRPSLPIQNIHPHQIDFMERFQKQDGLAFLLVRFRQHNETFYYPFDNLKLRWESASAGGVKSIPYSDFDKSLLITGKQGFIVHYLEGISTYLEKRHTE